MQIWKDKFPWLLWVFLLLTNYSCYFEQLSNVAMVIWNNANILIAEIINDINDCPTYMYTNVHEIKFLCFLYPFSLCLNCFHQWCFFWTLLYLIITKGVLLCQIAWHYFKVVFIGDTLITTTFWFTLHIYWQHIKAIKTDSVFKFKKKKCYWILNQS